ncbi:hypothetical protein D3C80_2194190 [compost metagenome]
MLALTLAPRVLPSLSIGMPAAQVGEIGLQARLSVLPGTIDCMPYQKRLSGPKSILCSTFS